MNRHFSIFAIFFAISVSLANAAKPGKCSDSILTCPAGKCMSNSDCAKLGKLYVWNEDKCDGDKCGCCELETDVSTCEASPSTCPSGLCLERNECAKLGKKYTFNKDKCPGNKCGCCEKPVCVKSDSECSLSGGKCVSSEAECPIESGATFNSTLCTTQPVVNGTGCGCCILPPQNVTCLKTDDACESLAPGARCVGNSSKCPPSVSGYIFNPSLCKEGTGEANCGCCFKPHKCKKSKDCTKKGGQCMKKAIASACPTETHMFDSSCGGDESDCGCCFPKP